MIWEYTSRQRINPTNNHVFEFVEGKLGDICSIVDRKSRYDLYRSIHFLDKLFDINLVNKWSQ